MPNGPDLLSASGKPLFFPVAHAGAVGVTLPSVRAGRGEAVRVWVRSLSVMQKEALVVSARTGAVWRLASDEGAYLDGHDVAPCPLSFFSIGMVAATMNEVQALAAQRGIALRDVTLVQDNFYTMKGSALRGTMTGGAKDVVLGAVIDADADDAALRALVCDAVAASPVSGLLRGAHPSLFTLTHNASAVDPDKAAPVATPAPPDPGDRFDAAEPATPSDASDWSDLIVRGGMSPVTENTSTYAGGSLAEHQDRLLHLRATCTLRADGVKEIEQHIYNPHGSIFRYLSDEAPGAGGEGRAPDAASYLAAGLGFCFMTQLGRYAAIVKKDLASYRIVQDMHLSLGGASGGTGQAGAADPVETHVYMRSGEDDGFARTCLDMSEQTCFLHAVCRTDLKTRVKVSRPTAA